MDIKEFNSLTLKANINKIILGSKPDDECTIPQLACEIGISDRSLNRWCNKLLSVSANQYVRHVKIKHAKYLLKESNSLSTVSEKLGFKTVQGFSRAFYLETGLSPREYFDNSNSDKLLKKVKMRWKILRVALNNYQSSEFNIPKFASLAGVSQRTLNRYCSNFFMLSSLQLINAVRLRKATILLDQNYSVSYVTKCVGFRTEGAFTKAFQNITGVNPKEYKEVHIQMRKNKLLASIQAYLGTESDLTSVHEIKFLLKEKLNIALPQKSTLNESLSSCISEHEIIGILKEYLELVSK